MITKNNLTKAPLKVCFFRWESGKERTEQRPREEEGGGKNEATVKEKGWKE